MSGTFPEPVAREDGTEGDGAQGDGDQGDGAQESGGDRPAVDDNDDEKTAGHRILAALARAGVSRVFGIPGGAIAPLYDALLDALLDGDTDGLLDGDTDGDTDGGGGAIEHVTCQHETMAVHVAAGHARATGEVAVVLVTSGPGVLNALTGVASALHDEVPLLLLAGEAARASIGRGALQDGSAESGIDLRAMLAPVTKAVHALVQPWHAEAIVARALDQARTPPGGPVLVQLPVDVSLRPRRGRQRIVTAGVRPPEPPAPALCDELATALERAERPALLLGLGARQPAVARAARELALWLRCPVITDLEGKGAFPEGHELSLGIFGVGAHGPARAYLEGGVDLLLTVGARLDDTLTAGHSALLRPGGLLAQLDHDPRRLCRAYAADVAVCCDLALALERIHGALPAPDPQRIAARARAVQALERDDPWAVTRDRAAPLLGPPFDPRVVARELGRLFGPEAIFVCDIGNHLLHAAQQLRVERADGFFVSYGFGAMGSGIGTAIGIQLGHQAIGSGRQVVAICGDGGLLMAGSELATCVQQQIPLVVAVFNDGQLGMVRHGIERTFGRALSLATPPLDAVAFARGLGARALRIGGAASLHGIVAEAAGGGGPLLVEIPIDPDVRVANPREAVVGDGKGAAE